MTIRGMLAVALWSSTLALGACSDKEGDTAGTDPSKLSAELESRAQQIEEKADMAAIAAEREAGAELLALREQAGTADEDNAEAADPVSSSR